MKKIVMWLIITTFILTLSACTVDNPAPDKEDNKPDPEEEVIEDELLELTLEQLSMYDGKDGNKAYIAVDGDIYDVTDEWTNGFHNGINAGQDVTEDIMGAPHGESVLQNLEKVGTLITE